MSEPRARSASDSELDRARRAYLALVGDHDPAAVWRGTPGVIDLRPGGEQFVEQWLDEGRSVVVSGPDDLIELRRVVERATGVATWPLRAAPTAGLLTATITIDHQAAMLALLIAMEEVIDDRSPWRTWRTAVDTVAAEVAMITSLTIQAAVKHP